MAEAIRRGAAVWLRRGSRIPHLYVILTDPHFDERTDKQSVLIVNLTTNRDGIGVFKYDPTCGFNKEDDPLITKDCFVLYRKADIVSLEKLERQIAEQGVEIERIGTETLAKICKGLEISNRRPSECWSFYQSARHSNNAN